MWWFIFTLQYCRDDAAETIDKIRAALKNTKEVASKREEALADAFSQQVN